MAKKTTRREFNAAMLSGLGLAVGLGVRTPALQAENGRVSVCVFSKHLQWLDYEAMAEEVARIGFDGVDLTVRPNGHVAPENAVTDLPKAVRAIRAAGLVVPMMTTAINSAEDINTEPILKTAVDLGIRFYRLGYFRYPKSGPLDETLHQASRSLVQLAELNERLGICGDYQNHAGEGHFGAPLWDLWFALKDIDPRWLGCQFDVRHATVEGSNSWPLDFRRLANRIHTITAKDFRWGQDGTALNCPLGEGLVDFPKLLSMLSGEKFSGPVSVHYEYELGGAEGGRRTLSVTPDFVRAAMKRDLLQLQQWLRDAGLRT